ncbi:MAG: DUF2062 domain-containing protein [Desulfobacterales bacterium]|jgi:hypothetical protein
MGKETPDIKGSLWRQLWIRIQDWINRVKNFSGDPHFVALGMACGVFVAATPTMPFQTVIAVTLAYFLRSSKAAAAIGVWLSNPITFPVFYLASYKVGTLLFSTAASSNVGNDSVPILKMGADITIAAFTGGLIIGLCLSTVTYFVTRKVYTKIRSCRRLNQDNVCESQL